GLAVGFERPLVTRQGFVQVPLDVGEDSQILLHTGAQLAAPSAHVQRLEERLARVVQGSRREIQAADGVERLRGEHVVADRPRHGEATATQLAGAPTRSRDAAAPPAAATLPPAP